MLLSMAQWRAIARQLKREIASTNDRGSTPNWQFTRPLDPLTTYHRTPLPIRAKRQQTPILQTWLSLAVQSLIVPIRMPGDQRFRVLDPGQDRCVSSFSYGI